MAITVGLNCITTSRCKPREYSYHRLDPLDFQKTFCDAFQPGLLGGGERRSGIVVRLSVLNYRDWQDVLCVLVPDVLSPETRRVASIRRLQLLWRAGCGLDPGTKNSWFCLLHAQNQTLEGGHEAGMPRCCGCNTDGIWSVQCLGTKVRGNTAAAVSWVSRPNYCCWNT